MPSHPSEDSSIIKIHSDSIGEIYHATLATFLNPKIEILYTEKFRKKFSFLHPLAQRLNSINKNWHLISGAKEKNILTAIQITKIISSSNKNLVSMFVRLLESLPESRKIEVQKFIEINFTSLDERLVFLWLRNKSYRKERASTGKNTQPIIDALRKHNFRIYPIGNSFNEADDHRFQDDWHSQSWQHQYYKWPPFVGDDSLLAQLYFFKELREQYLKANKIPPLNVGLISGGMDGPCFLGCPTIEIGESCYMSTRMGPLLKHFSLNSIGLSVSEAAILGNAPEEITKKLDPKLDMFLQGRKFHDVISIPGTRRLL